MTITELALLRLLPPTAVDDASLRQKLANAKSVMEKYTGRKFYFFQQIEEPALLYIVGEWESLEQHMNDFIPSAENQDVLNNLKEELTVEWLIHIDAPHASLPLPTTKIIEGRPVAGSHILSIARLFVSSGDNAKFRETFDANKHHLQYYLTEGGLGHGWRVDKEDAKEEFVLITPWTDVDQHMSFAKTEAFTKYAQIRPFLDGNEIKHAKLLVL
ncbi:hypothetical protein K491DRAFT_693887 [Lophiostoma macrostomum CBS 122681]|uniref:ABM domain-containing protein n=1 Tax=Lophiostoma macrostomum CBS 122681 TaxID=1314788 RepID=A0A6A6T4X9_9PLEO|nr:hypothetical protein K491DRAFT_693887 [Lophiostoma macrostomum CBS 122681]